MTVTKPGDEAVEHALAVSAAGEAVAVWVSPRRKHRSVIQAASHLPGGNWSTPKTISPSGSFEPQVAVNDAGEAVAVWRHRTGGRKAASVVAQSASRSPDGRWSAATTLVPRPVDLWEPKVAINDAGEAVATWDSSFRNASHVVQSVSRSPLGAWSTPIDVFPRVDGLDGLSPQIAITASGEAIAMRGRLNNGFEGVVETASRPAGGRWSRAVKLIKVPFPGIPPEPLLAVNDGGEAVAIWELWEEVEHDHLETSLESASRPPGGDWSRPASFYKAPTSLERVVPDLAINEAGEAVAAWEGYGAGNTLVQSASRTPSGDWSQPTSVFRGHRVDTYDGIPIVTTGQFAPEVAISRAGKAIAVWPAQDGIIRAAYRPLGDGWTPAARLSKEGDDYYPLLAISDSGEAVATWAQAAPGRNAILRSSSLAP